MRNAHRFRFLLLCVVLPPVLSVASAQRYEVGDIVENFTLTDRATGEPIHRRLPFQPDRRHQGAPRFLLGRGAGHCGAAS